MLDKSILNQLTQYAQLLEKHFHDLVGIEFVVENGNVYMISSQRGRCTPQASLKIALSMFCEGKMSAEDVVNRIPYRGLEELLNQELIVNKDELKIIAKGYSVSAGIGYGKICLSIYDAEKMINEKKDYILYIYELYPDIISYVTSIYCKGVISERGGMTSHAAVVCRNVKKPCVSCIDNREKTNGLHMEEVTIDGNQGIIYLGHGIIETKNKKSIEIEHLHYLLSTIIKYNIILNESSPLVWRLWDVAVLRKRHTEKKRSNKKIVEKKKYKSFVQPTQIEIDNIYAELSTVKNADVMVGDFIDFLYCHFFKQVPIGNHYVFMRPLLNPMDSIKMCANACPSVEERGIQLTALEFYNVNKYIDFLLDIYSIKIFFSTEFYKINIAEDEEPLYEGVNYLDFTNPNGESLNINNTCADGLSLYINDVWIPTEKVMSLYHFMRRREYYWSWYDDNHISKNEIIDYLKSNKYEPVCKKYYLCEEMNLLENGDLTVSGKTLIGELQMSTSKKIEYILDQILLRGYDDKPNEYDDFSDLIQRKEFKDLISLELYEYYFWEERHEFDLQLIKAVVEKVCDYFSDPNVIEQIKSGLLQNIPSAVILSSTTLILKKLVEIKQNRKKETEENSGWKRMERNIKKIDTEFSNHDHILSDEIERIFGTSREEILPLLKLYGCKAYYNKTRSIWLKTGLKDARVREILKNNKFKYK